MTRQTQPGPTSVTSEETQRSAGEEALALNVAAAEGVTDAVRTTLEPPRMGQTARRRLGRRRRDQRRRHPAVGDGHLPPRRPVADTGRDDPGGRGGRRDDLGRRTGWGAPGRGPDLVDDGVHPTTVATGTGWRPTSRATHWTRWPGASGRTTSPGRTHRRDGDDGQGRRAGPLDHPRLGRRTGRARGTGGKTAA